jgi:capsular polysaccharide export protein
MSASKVHYLFLQGEPTSFYKRVGDGLSALGCKVTRINFCAGDQLFWHGPNTLNYRGTFADWSDFFISYLDSNNVTNLFLCGEQRSFHKVAIEIAQGRGIRVVVTDLGYLRPDWITLERDGMNGSSRFPRDPERIMALAKNLPEIDRATRYESNPLRVEVHYLLFELANYFLFFLFPHYRRTDNKKHLLLNYLFGLKKFLLSKSNNSRAMRHLGSLKKKGEPYFVFPLQLENDYSIISYSPFASLDEPIRLVIKSFAQNSSAATRLIF